MVKERHDIRPILVKFGVAVALSFAGFLYSRLKSRRAKFSKPPQSPCSSDHVGEVDDDVGRAGMKQRPIPSSFPSISADKHEDTFALKIATDNPFVVLSPSSRHNVEKDRCLLPEFDDLGNEFDLESPRSGVETPREVRAVDKEDHEQEIRHLKAMVQMLQEREKNLEFQLLEFYGLKEQETAMMELQNRLKISNMETKLFTLKIQSLQTDNQRLQAQVADHAKIVAELDAARAKIKLLRKRLKCEAEQNKEHILALQKRVSRLQEEELQAAANDPDIKLQLQRLKDLEVEAEDLRKSNLRLSSENSELARQLESTKILANSVLEDPETEAFRELGNKLKQENEDLAKEVERLHAERYNDTEELVYLRWINACLRYELRNFQPAHGKTVARDLSKSLSPKSEEKAKQLILEYANSEEMGEKGNSIMDFDSDQWSSSRTSYVMDSGDFDDSVASSKTSNFRKTKFFNKLRRLVQGKDIQHQNHVSSVEKTGVLEESDFSRSSSSTATDAASDGKYSRGHGLPLDLSSHVSRHSADIQGVKNPRIDEMKDLQIARRNSDIGFSYGHRRYLSGMITANQLSPEHQPEQRSFSSERSELLKFAEVLKDSGSRTRTLHKKSVSFGSYGAFQRASSQ